MLGFDTRYQSCWDDPQIAAISSSEDRVLLTRDRGLLKRGEVTYGYWLRETDSKRQMVEVVRRFGLAEWVRPFTRCMACNGVLGVVSLDEVRALVPPGVAELHEESR